MSPDQFKALFDMFGVFFIFVWGLVVKYHPKLASLPNSLINWSGALVYVLMKLAAPSMAHAAGFDLSVVPSLGSVLLSGFTSAAWARSLYECFGRPAMEYLIARRKAKEVPVGQPSQ